MVLDLVIRRYRSIFYRDGFVCNSPKALLWAEKKIDSNPYIGDLVFSGGVLIGLVCWVCNNDWYEPIL